MNRVAVFAFGVTSYVIFLLTFLYSFGWGRKPVRPPVDRFGAIRFDRVRIPGQFYPVGHFFGSAQRYGAACIQELVDKVHSKCSGAKYVCFVFKPGSDSADVVVAADGRDHLGY